MKETERKKKWWMERERAERTEWYGMVATKKARSLIKSPPEPGRLQVATFNPDILI
jgi:hypothetical protein